MNVELLRKIRAFAKDELVPAQASLDSFSDAPSTLCNRFRQLGLANWWLPMDRREGGLGLVESVDLVSELAYGDAGIAFTQFISILGSSMVALYGSDALRERFLTPLRARGSYCATLGSEEHAGSELTKMSTRATRSGADLVINGEKFFSTNADFADFLVVIAHTTEVGAPCAVVVPRDTPGIQIVKRWNLTGLCSSATYQVSLRDCRVPSSNLLHGNGLRLLEIGLNASRILIGASALGIARRIRDLCMEYAKTKPLRDATLLKHPVFAAKLAQMEMQIEVMRNQCLAAAAEFDQIVRGPQPAEEFVRRGSLKSALTTKLFCGQVGWQIASVGSEMFGGLGYTHDLVMGKLLRDMRYVAIVEGGDDVLRDIIFSRYVVPVARRV